MKHAKHRVIAGTAILLVTLLLAGCYWTPAEQEGAITLEIDSSELRASQTQDYDGFFFGYVVADDLLRGDQTAAEEAFAEVNTALDEALTQNPESPEDFAINIAFPSIQLQANLFRGSSGTNTFAGLRAGREYLVVITAGTDTTDGIGYAITTVNAGENKTVSLDLGSNYAEFDRFLADRYGVVQGDPGPQDITVNLQPTGTLSTVPGTLYYDLVDVSSTDFSLFEYYDTYQSQTYVSEDSALNGPDLSSALGTLSLINSDGSPISSASSGTRLELPADNTIRGVSGGMSVRVLIVDVNARSETSPMAGATVMALSDPISVGYSSNTITLPLFEWATGF